MSWLKQLGEHVGLRSFDAIAKRVLSSDHVAPSVKKRYKTHRSLANRLRRFEKGEDGRLLEEAGPALAEALGVEVSKLEQLLEGSCDPAGDVLVLTDLGRARVGRIDLRSEGLFPGIPRCVLEPRKWEHAWWLAPSGAGKHVVASWLEARGLATVIRATHWGEVPPLLAQRPGPYYVVLESGELPEASALPKSLCVATREVPSGAGWNLLESPPREEWLDRLLGWVQGKLSSSGGGFDAEAARAVAERYDAFETPGHVLALCGLVEEVGASKLRQANIRELAQHYMDVALGRASTIGSRIQLELSKHAAEVVVGLCKGLLCAEEEPERGVSLERFEPFLPPSLSSLADSEGARAVLETSEGTDAEKVARLREKLGPGPAVVVRALRDLRVLEPRGQGFRLKPWLRRLASPEAARELIREGGPALGHALARPHAAPLLLDELRNQFASEDLAPLQRALDADTQEPAGVAAFEGCFRALGVAVLQGAEVPRRLLERAWRRQFEIAIRRYDDYPPVPLLGWQDDSRWLALGTWFVGCLAISEQIEAEWPVEFSWTSPPAPLLARILDEVSHAAWERRERPPWWPDVFALSERMVERETFPPAQGLPDLLLPAATVRAVREGAPDLPCGLAWLLRRTRPWLEPFRELAGVEFPALLRAFWNDWAKQEDLSALNFNGFSEAFARELWEHAPPELCEGPLFEVILDWDCVPLGVLSEAQWRAFFSSEHWSDDYAWINSEARRRLWRAVPASIALELLERGPLSHHTAREAQGILWEQHSDLLLEWASERVVSGDLSVLAEAPRESRPTLLDVLRMRVDWTNLSDSETLLLRGWLYDFVKDRGSGWERAFEVLIDLARPVSGGDDFVPPSGA